MTASQNPMPDVRPSQYAEGVAGWLVERYASGEPGTSLPALHRADPGMVPSPAVVRKWRRERPGFDAAMVEAESIRADALAEATIEIADSDRNAAQARNQIAARWRMAEALSPERYRARAGGDGLAVVVVLTDAQLLAIAAGADPAALLGVASGVMTPTAPPVSARAGLTGGSEVRPAPHTFRSPVSLAQDVEYTDLPAREVAPEKNFVAPWEFPGE